MIRAPLIPGAAFSEAADGDIRNDLDARASLSEALGVSDQWAVVTQVHGAGVVRANTSGELGEADALWTPISELPLAVFTADCFGVVLRGEGVVGVAHAGWRGIRAGVVAALRAEMETRGAVRWAAIGPGIGSCCFEVGEDVLGQFVGHESTTSWNTPSVNLENAIAEQLDGVEVWMSRKCTHHEDGFFSHRRTGTGERLAAIGWIT